MSLKKIYDEVKEDMFDKKKSRKKQHFFESAVKFSKVFVGLCDYAGKGVSSKFRTSLSDCDASISRESR